MKPEQVQALMDAGRSVSEIGRHFDVHHEVINRIIKRNNLEWYIAFDEVKQAEPKFWFYDDQFKLFKSEYGYESKSDCMRDAIGEFLCQFDANEITIGLLKQNRHIEAYSYELYGSLPEMYKYYGIDKTAVEYSMNKKARVCAALGHEFDRLVKEVFDEIGHSYEQQKSINGCRPDYIVGEKWYDAKLSRSTAFNYGCETIEKYLKHTDSLTIIYALHDTEQDEDNVTFISIEEYKHYVSFEIQRKIDAFIRKATEVRFGASNRLSYE